MEEPLFTHKQSKRLRELFYLAKRLLFYLTKMIGVFDYDEKNCEIFKCI